MSKPRTRFNIEVTAKDIENAHIGDSYRCVVARAIARQIPNARKIDVDLQTIRWSDEDGRHAFLTPYAVAGYIVAFDAGDEIHPFTFQVRDPIPTIQRRAMTEAALTAKRSQDAITNERRKVKRAETVLANPEIHTDKAVAVAQERVRLGPERIRAAQADHENVKAGYQAAGEPMSRERVSEATRRLPRVFKTKRREYGSRVLRVNQAEERKHYA